MLVLKFNDLSGEILLFFFVGQACGKDGLTPPYGRIKDRKLDLHVKDMGVEAFKQPSNHRVKKFKAIWNSHDNIAFKMGPVNEPDNGQCAQFLYNTLLSDLLKE